MRPALLPIVVSSLIALSATFAACGGDDAPPPAAAGGSSGAVGSAGSSAGSSTGGSAATRPEQTGATCKVAGDCYPGLDQTKLSAPAVCLDRVREGYCTHGCSADADCCAAEGECKTSFKQVCSPFESTGNKTCFLSCEGADTGGADEATYCQKNASFSFICRSSGGGKENRKVCVPGQCGAGAVCASDAECTGGLTCLTAFNGGYCGKATCTTNAECGNGSQCITHTDGKNYCLKSCGADSECSFCRSATLGAKCVDTVTFAEAGTVGKVCVPD